jgi:hypothetical protein
MVDVVLHEPFLNHREYLFYDTFADKQVKVSIMICLSMVFTKDDHPVRVSMLR